MMLSGCSSIVRALVFVDDVDKANVLDVDVARIQNIISRHLTLSPHIFTLGDGVSILPVAYFCFGNSCDFKNSQAKTLLLESVIQIKLVKLLFIREEVRKKRRHNYHQVQI